MSKGVITSDHMINQVFGLSSSQMTEVTKAANVFNMSHGMFAAVPLVCRADKCPYKDVCTVSLPNRIIAQRCPMETGAVIGRFDYWCRHFGVEVENGLIGSMDAADASLIRDLVDLEIQILRASNKIAMSGDFIGMTIADVDRTGKEHLEETISPAAQFKMQLMDKMHKVLQLLNATRKDKVNELKVSDHPSVKTATLINKMQEMLKDKDLDDIDVIDIDYKVEEEPTDFIINGKDPSISDKVGDLEKLDDDCLEDLE